MPSPSINLIKASDGTGNAAMATVQSTRAPLATTLIVNTVDNIPSTFIGTMGTPHTFVDPITAEEIVVISEATAVDFTGHVDGTNLEIDAIADGYTDLGSAANDVIIIKPTTEWANNVAELLAVAHNDDGTLKAVVANQGWTDVTGTTVTSVTANGNRSYTVGVDTDLRTIVSPGMRLRTTRTVAAPTQCTSLNGTTQYYSCPSATVTADMTFTDDFVAGAWVKLSSYATGAIISRYNGTSGWQLRVDSTGQIAMLGYNAGGANFSYVLSYQSIPLNKWVYVSAQLDMSAFTATTTTSYVMIDGVDVPASVGRGGTNPTALIQAGDLQVGAVNGAAFFPGKIAQAFVSSAKITQANIKTLYSQGLTASLISTNSIISAYSFDNAITDLNTTSANNLTAQGSAVATNADSFAGGQADGTISSTLDHAIIQKVTASTITVQVAEGCTIPTSGGVSSLSYATVKSPYGFPSQSRKWRVLADYRTLTTTSNTAYAQTAGHQISAPVGEWSLCAYHPIAVPNSASFGIFSTYTISTSTSAETDKNMSTMVQNATATAAGNSTRKLGFVSTDISVSAQTTYYRIDSASTASLSHSIDATSEPATIYLENSYL